jgi:hypothetical protein
VQTTRAGDLMAGPGDLGGGWTLHAHGEADGLRWHEGRADDGELLVAAEAHAAQTAAQAGQSVQHAFSAPEREDATDGGAVGSGWVAFPSCNITFSESILASEPPRGSGFDGAADAADFDDLRQRLRTQSPALVAGRGFGSSGGGDDCGGYDAQRDQVLRGAAAVAEGVTREATQREETEAEPVRQPPPRPRQPEPPRLSAFKPPTSRTTAEQRGNTSSRTAALREPRSHSGGSSSQSSGAAVSPAAPPASLLAAATAALSPPEGSESATPSARELAQQAKAIRNRRNRAVYSCQFCGYSCSSKSSLERHIRVHTGEKPYECRECGRQFRQRSTLSAHERVHTGATPFQCMFSEFGCMESFRHRPRMFNHMRSCAFDPHKSPRRRLSRSPRAGAAGPASSNSPSDSLPGPSPSPPQPRQVDVQRCELQQLQQEQEQEEQQDRQHHHHQEHHHHHQQQQQHMLPAASSFSSSLIGAPAARFGSAGLLAQPAAPLRLEAFPSHM